MKFIESKHTVTVAALGILAGMKLDRLLVAWPARWELTDYLGLAVSPALLVIAQQYVKRRSVNAPR